MKNTGNAEAFPVFFDWLGVGSEDQELIQNLLGQLANRLGLGGCGAVVGKFLF